MDWPRHEPYGMLPVEDNYGYHHHPPPSELERTRHPSFDSSQYHSFSPPYHHHFDHAPPPPLYRPRPPTPSYSNPTPSYSRPPPPPSYFHEPARLPPSYPDSPNIHSPFPPPQPLFSSEDNFDRQHRECDDRLHPFPPYHQDTSFSSRSLQSEWFPSDFSSDPMSQRGGPYSAQEDSDFTDHSHFSSPSGPPQPTFDRLRERNCHPRYPSPIRRERRHSTSSSDRFQHPRSSYSHPPRKQYSEEKRPDSRCDTHRSVFKRLEPQKAQSSAPSEDVLDSSRGSVLHRLGPVILPGSLPPQPGPNDLRKELDTRQASSLSSTPPSSSQLLVRIQNSAHKYSTATDQKESDLHSSSWNGIFSHADDTSSHTHQISSPVTISPIMPFPKERFAGISDSHDTSGSQDGLLPLPQKRSASSTQFMPSTHLPSNTNEELSSSGHKHQSLNKSTRRTSSDHLSSSVTSDYNKESVKVGSSSQTRSSIRSGSSQECRSSTRHKQSTQRLGDHEKSRSSSASLSSSRSSTKHGKNGSISSTSSASAGKRLQKRQPSLSPTRSNAKRSSVSRVTHVDHSSSSAAKRSTEQRVHVSLSSDSSLVKTSMSPMKSVSSSSLAIHPAISPQSVANQMKVVGSHDELPICSSNDDSLSVNIEKTSTPLLTQSDSDSSSKHVSPNSHYSLRVLEQCRPQKSKKVVPKGLKKACSHATSSHSPVVTAIDSSTNSKVGEPFSTKQHGEMRESNSEHSEMPLVTTLTNPLLSVPSSGSALDIPPSTIQTLSDSDVLDLAHKVIVKFQSGLFEQLHVHVLPFTIDTSMLIILWKSVSTIYSTVVGRSGNLDNLSSLSDYCIGTVSLLKTSSCSAMHLYEEELAHFCNLCGTSLNLWMYHILRHYSFVLGCCNSDNSLRLLLKSIVDSLVCVMDELQPSLSSSFSCSSLPDDTAHSIARELYNDSFVYQLVAVPLPGFTSTTIFAVLFNATVHALTCLRHHPSSSGPFFSNALTEFAIGSVAGEVTVNSSTRIPSPDILYRQELSSMYERCGENCPLWRCLVMKYWALVRYSPAPTVNMVSKQTDETKSLEEAIKSDLDLAELMYRILHDMPLQTTTQSQSVSMLLSTNNLPSDQQTSHLSDCDDLIIVDSPAEVEPSCGPSFGLFLEDRKPDLSLLHQEFLEASQPSELVNKDEHMLLCREKGTQKIASLDEIKLLESNFDHPTSLSSQGAAKMKSTQLFVNSSSSQLAAVSSPHVKKQDLPPISGEWTNQASLAAHVDEPSSPVLSSVLSPLDIQPVSPPSAEGSQESGSSLCQSTTTVNVINSESAQKKSDATTHVASVEINPASVHQEQESPEPGEIVSDEDIQKEKKNEEPIQKSLLDRKMSRQPELDDFSPVRSSPRNHLCRQHSPRYSSNRKNFHGKYYRGRSEYRPKQTKTRSRRTRKHSNDDQELNKLRKEALESRSKVRKTTLGSDTEKKGELMTSSKPTIQSVQHESSKPANGNACAEQRSNQGCGTKEENNLTSVEVSPRSVGLLKSDDRRSDSDEGKSAQIGKGGSPKLSIMESPQTKAGSPLLRESSNNSPQTPLAGSATAFRPIQLPRAISLPLSFGLDGDVAKRVKLASSRVASPYNSPVRSPSVSASLPTSCSSIKVVTNKNTTWKVEAFTIAVSQDEEDHSDVEDALEKSNKGVDDQQQVSMADINEMIKSCREEVEAKVLPADTAESPMTIAPPVLEMLPAKQQKEYHHLRKRLIAAQQQQKRQQAVASQKKSITLSTLTNRKRSRELQQMQTKKLKLQSFCEGLKQDELLLSSLTSALKNCKATATEQSSLVKHLQEELKSAENNLLATQKKQLLLERKVEETSERVTQKQSLLPKLQQQLNSTEEISDSWSSDQSPERMQQTVSVPVKQFKESPSDTLGHFLSFSLASGDSSPNTASCDPVSEFEDSSVNISDDDGASKPKSIEKSAIESLHSSALVTVAVSEMISENEQQETTDSDMEDSNTESTNSEKNQSPSKLQISSATAAIATSNQSSSASINSSLQNKFSDAVVALPPKPTHIRQPNSSMQRKLLQRVVEGQRQIQKVKEGLIAVLANQATTSQSKTGDTTPPTAVVKPPRNSSSSVKIVLNEQNNEDLHRVLRALGVQESNFGEISTKLSALNLYGVFQAMLPDTDPLCPLTPLYLVTGLVMNQILSLPDDSSVISEGLLLKALERTVNVEPKPLALNSKKFTSYASPLLTFQSYRLKPYFRTQFSLPLSSATYSHRINPEQIVCRFELQGRCNDPQCPAQHFSDMIPSTDQLVADISSYQSNTSDGAPDSSLDKLDNFRGKVSDDELLQLAAHSTRERLLKEKSGSSSLSCSSLTQPPRNKTVDESRAEGVIPPVMVISSDSPMMPLDPQHSTKGMLRYWDSSPQDQPSDSHCQENTSEEFWVDYIPKKAASIVASSSASSPSSASQSKDNDEITTLDQLFNKAACICPSYPVLAIVISLAPTITSKHHWIEKSLHLITDSVSSEDQALSHSVLQLLLSAIVLHLETGCVAEAVKLLKTATIKSKEVDNEQSNTSGFRGILSFMTLDDKLFLCHCYLYLVAFNNLPPCLSGHCIPIKLTSKQLFVIPWNKATMTPSKKKEIFDIFKVFQLACLDKSLPQSVGFARCSNFYVTFVLFEYCHSSVSAALRCLQRLLDVVPSSSMLSLLFVQLLSASGAKENAWKHLQASLESCPKDPLLYYFAARLELKQCTHDDDNDDDDKSSVSACAKAVNWLELCVRNYYDINSSDLSSLDHCDLYRNLLGLSIPYDYTPPTLSETLTSESRRQQLAPLWLCYCLFVELTSSVSSDDIEEAFESAIHSLSEDKVGLELLWWSYLVVKMEVACKRSATVQSVKQFLDCAQRCLLVINDRSMSNDAFLSHQIIEMMLRCVPQSLRVRILHSIILLQPYSSLLLTRLAECTWKGDQDSIDSTQSVLATYLSRQPYQFSLWIVAIITELRQHHYREARWLFVQASKHHPFNRQLWIEFMLFELKCMVEGVHSDSQLQDLLSRCQQVNVSWMNYIQQYLATFTTASYK